MATVTLEFANKFFNKFNEDGEFIGKKEMVKKGGRNENLSKNNSNSNNFSVDEQKNTDTIIEMPKGNNNTNVQLIQVPPTAVTSIRKRQLGCFFGIRSMMRLIGVAVCFLAVAFLLTSPIDDKLMIGLFLLLSAMINQCLIIVPCFFYETGKNRFCRVMDILAMATLTVGWITVGVVFMISEEIINNKNRIIAVCFIFLLALVYLLSSFFAFFIGPNNFASKKTTIQSVPVPEKLKKPTKQIAKTKPIVGQRLKQKSKNKIIGVNRRK